MSKEWHIEAVEYAKEVYGVTLDDLGYVSGDEIGESPIGYVERLAEKYDLRPIADLIAITDPLTIRVAELESEVWSLQESNEQLQRQLQLEQKAGDDMQTAMLAAYHCMGEFL